MAEKSVDLPQECWELIFNSLDHHRYFESLSLVSIRFLSITDQLPRTFTISSQVIPFLPCLLSRFRNLKEIEIREFEGDLNSLLYQISKSGLDLETLSFSKQNLFPLMGVRELGLRMRNLRKLNCSKVVSLQDSDLFVIGNSFPLLEDLDISFPQYYSRFNPNGSLALASFSGVVTDEGIFDLAMKLNRLCKINLSGNHFITDKSLQSLSSNCALLREVVIHDCDFLTQNGISFIMRNCDNLCSISLDSLGIPYIDSFFQESFSYAKTLCELHLQIPNLTAIFQNSFDPFLSNSRTVANFK
ncbi:hypothetical protein JCGZ_27030 [Jatropha curcas]|uniref:F-box domain-containing protein n=1 Tax=Jatropha curcas TaxID=180498 RepID=A0A067L0Q5_JATCU|nr:hypothetical protein JCGZ_27030 [Jatropha curcas]